MTSHAFRVACLLLLGSVGGPAARGQTPTYQILYSEPGSWGDQSFTDFNDAGTFIGNYNVGYHGAMFGTVHNSPFALHDGLYNFSDLNTAGSIAGYEWSGEVDNRFRAAVLINGTKRVLAGWDSFARAINDSGNVAGYGGRPEGGMWLWKAATDSYLSIGAYPGSSPINKMRINASDTVAYDRGGRIYYWSQAIGERSWFDVTNTRNYALAGISDQGWIAITSDPKGGQSGVSQGLLRKPDGTILNFSTMLGVARTELTSMSESGVVLGRSNTLGTFVWTESSGFTFIKFPTPPPGVYPSLNPFGVNNSGQIVGMLTTDFLTGGTNYALVIAGPVPGPGGACIGLVFIACNCAFRRRRGSN